MKELHSYETVPPITYAKKTERIKKTDREFIREELAWLAEWIRNKYPYLTVDDLSRYLREMINVTI